MTKKPTKLQRSRIKKRRRKLWLKNPYCSYCERKITFAEATIDHIIPISKNGPHHQDNYALSCYTCNKAKANKDVIEFMEELE